MNFRSIVSSGPARRWPAWHAAATILLAALPFTSGARAAEPIKIGLVTALSGQSARAGEALTRGATIAIEEINAKGGVLGRPLELVRRDDESNPAKGLIAARELIQREKVAVLVGGLDTPVELAIVPFRQQRQGAVRRAVGRRDQHHAERRAVQLRVPRLGHGR
ncbi:ABC-type branched-subunit amino acid transport system substrate-binding protein [Bradyrhizobium elkanii]